MPPALGRRAADLAKQVLPAWLVIPLLRLRHLALPVREGSSRQVLARIGTPAAVLAGPFTGTRLLDLQRVTNMGPMLLGTYERELHGAIERLCAARPDRVVNIGAGEGYYAVGLARRLPAARVIAVDTDRLCRGLLRRTAEMNGVAGRVEIEPACPPERLQALLAGAERPAVVSDCEGYERTVLDPAAVPALAAATMLVEVHEFFHPGTDALLRARFRDSHRLTVIEEVARSAADLPPGLPPLSARDTALLLQDGRVGFGRWFLLEPRSRA